MYSWLPQMFSFKSLLTHIHNLSQPSTPRSNFWGRSTLLMLMEKAKPKLVGWFLTIMSIYTARCGRFRLWLLTLLPKRLSLFCWIIKLYPSLHFMLSIAGSQQQTAWTSLSGSSISSWFAAVSRPSGPLWHILHTDQEKQRNNCISWTIALPRSAISCHACAAHGPIQTRPTNNHQVTSREISRRLSTHLSSAVSFPQERSYTILEVRASAFELVWIANFTRLCTFLNFCWHVCWEPNQVLYWHKLILT